MTSLHFDVLCDLLLLNRRTATWNLFVNSILMRKSFKESLLALTSFDYFPIRYR